ncbi:MAG: proline/glycine betaine ABC transporter permease [Desulfobacterales bacterium]|nr:proline/glycine betaine ABC transporter permease [Desulfobacterales bacterium]MDD4072024.1 proline/glycine betaine ABC transporter permease [Desulfobacterales bacterium]MDD4392601.1 proline/glycine betaine ABC transporter permease [Desulfobacterales bacterium]
MLDFPEYINIPLGEAVDVSMDWILLEFGTFFDALGAVILQFMLGLEKFFLWVPWPVFIIFVGLFSGYLMKKWYMGLIMSAMLFFIGTIGLWKLSMMTLALVTGAVIISLAIGIPIGIAMAGNDKFETVFKPFLDGMQTMPSFVYLIPALMLFGLGKVPALFATIIYSVPPVIRLTNVGIREVSSNVVEAANAFGSSYWQRLFKVQLPLARPTIMVGINQTTMMALAMVVVASMIGARGLGLEVLLSINRIEIGRGVEAGLCIVFLAIIIDRITYALAAPKRQSKASS